MKIIRRKKNDIEWYRIKIDNILKKYELKSNREGKQFYLFLYNDDFNQFNTWFKICSAKNNFDENIIILQKILDIFKKSNSVVSFKKLFEIDKNWYDFFKQNSDIDGNLLENEQRLGVDKEYVNDISLIQKKVKMFDKDLDLCISFYSEIKLIIFRKQFE